VGVGRASGGRGGGGRGGGGVSGGGGGGGGGGLGGGGGGEGVGRARKFLVSVSEPTNKTAPSLRYTHRGGGGGGVLAHRHPRKSAVP